MNEEKLRSIIEASVRKVLSQKEDVVAGKEDSQLMKDESLDDITEIAIKKWLLVENALNKEGYYAMKDKTPSRVGAGRAGTRYLTKSTLRFRADHAAAQDAVFSYVDSATISQMNLLPVETKCKDKDEFLTRPDLGKQLTEESMRTIHANVTKSADVQIVVGDGLSSAAIEANIQDILPAIQQGLKNYEFEVGKVFFVKHCRVGVMDEIGEMVKAKVVCLLIGERPGLLTAESMSAYIAYKPTVNMPEARRTVISNIHKGGTSAVEAGAHIASLIKTMLEKKASGVDLKNTNQ